MAFSFSVKRRSYLPLQMSVVSLPFNIFHVNMIFIVVQILKRADIIARCPTFGIGLRLFKTIFGTPVLQRLQSSRHTYRLRSFSSTFKICNNIFATSGVFFIILITLIIQSRKPSQTSLEVELEISDLRTSY